MHAAAPSLSFTTIDYNVDADTDPQVSGNVTVVCTAAGRPRPSTPVWRFANLSRLQTSDAFILSSNDSLPSANGLHYVSSSFTILDVDAMDRLEYLCESFNGINGSESSDIYFTRTTTAYTSTATYSLNVHGNSHGMSSCAAVPYSREVAIR